MSEINTIRQDSIPSAPLDTVPTSLMLSNVSFVPPKSDLATVFNDFCEFLAKKTAKTTQRDLEKSLFLLHRDLAKIPNLRSVSLDPLKAVHPFAAMSASDAHVDSLALVDREMRRIITREPLLAQKYMWMLKAAEFLSDLGFFWGFLTPAAYQHRAHLHGTVLADCPRLESLCILPEVLYVAAAPEALTLPENAKSMCEGVAKDLTKCLELLVMLLKSIAPTPMRANKSATPNRIAPSILKATEFMAAARLRIHSLSLPRWWKCACVQSTEERFNVRLKSQLSSLCASYLALEAALAHHSA